MITSTDQHSQESDQRHADEVADLLFAVLHPSGSIEPSTREAAFRGGELPPLFREYVDKILGESYRITDDDIKELLAAGYSQDAIFEITVSAALGAATQRLEAGLSALKKAG
jgi:hypothetical protein